MTHRLEMAYWLAELRAVAGMLDGAGQGRLRGTEDLVGNR